MDRYAIDFDTRDLQKEHADVVIIGSGIAGIFTALELDESLSVCVITKDTPDVSNSSLAQGGIAVSLDKGDSPELHLKDTLFAGAGLCDDESVRVLVYEAARNIEALCRYGVNFDRKDATHLALTREGAHSRNRIIHAGDTTGKEVCDTLIAEVIRRPNVRLMERTFAVDLLTDDAGVHGVLIKKLDSGELRVIETPYVVCATGGFGQVYADTTNPEVATGDGLMLARRAGAKLMDMEFVQFHPTVLSHPENRTFLISEAVRGEGAVLRNHQGRCFMEDYHPLKDLAPRDVVSRAIFSEMQKTGSSHMWLDITHKDQEYLENRFPNIFRTCLQLGIHMATDYIPVAPAQHYAMGGIRTDVSGRTGIEGLFACGEAACTGIHGANRLASNSLLEGLVFGKKITEEINRVPHPERHLQEVVCASGRPVAEADFESIRTGLRRMMTDKVGILRSRKSLEQALEALDTLNSRFEGVQAGSVYGIETLSMVQLCRMTVQAALQREESRGAHYRTDFPETDDQNWKRNLVF